jgi:LuxR family maltose regulon positive regulatory protein
MHSILRDYLLERFEASPPGFAKEARARAGSACAMVSEYFQAAKFFALAGDYKAVISMPFTARYFYNNFDLGMLDFFERFVKECPRPVIEESPIFLVMIAYFMFRNGRRDALEEITGLIRSIIGGSGGLSGKDMARLKGEFALLMSFTRFNDIAGMSEYHREAFRMFETLGERPARSMFFGGNIPWTFGCPSVFFLYWRQAGELGKELEYMDECVPIYSKITNGHGAGGGDVMRAEGLLLRGDDAGAEVAAHRAIYLASEENQTGNRLCAELVLARLAILRGDGAAYASVRSDMLEHARNARQRAVFLLGELARSLLSLTLGMSEDLPDWLSDAKRISNVLYVHARPYALTLYGNLLLLGHRYAELRALSGTVMDMARGMNLLLPQVYQHIYLAAAGAENGNVHEAREHLSAALNLTAADKIYLPFAQHWSILEPAFRTLETPPLGEDISAIRVLAERQASGAARITKRMASSKSPLTPREREIALLAKERLSASEIASKLFISENTVNSALKIIYGKLDIHSKADLAKKEF